MGVGVADGSIIGTGVGLILGIGDKSGEGVDVGLGARVGSGLGEADTPALGVASSARTVWALKNGNRILISRENVAIAENNFLPNLFPIVFVLDLTYKMIQLYRLKNNTP